MSYTIDATAKYGEASDLKGITQIIGSIVRPAQIDQVDLSILLYDGYCVEAMGWETWAKETTGLERRMCYNMRAIGQMMRDLGEEVYQLHKTSQTSKLAIVTALCENDQREFLKDDMINRITRDELRLLVDEKLGKVKPSQIEQPNFLKLLCELAEEALNENDAFTFANELPITTIFNSSCRVMEILEQASVAGRLTSVPQADRNAFAASLRELATQIES